MVCFIISAEKSQRFEEVQSITLPGASGELQILPSHAEAFVNLISGNIVIKGKVTTNLPIEGGVCHIKDDFVTIIL